MTPTLRALQGTAIATLLAMLTACSAASDTSSPGSDPGAGGSGGENNGGGGAGGGSAKKSTKTTSPTIKGSGGAGQCVASGEFGCDTVDAGDQTEPEKKPDAAVKPPPPPVVDAATEKVCHVVQGFKGGFGTDDGGQMWCEGH